LADGLELHASAPAITALTASSGSWTPPVTAREAFTVLERSRPGSVAYRVLVTLRRVP